MLCSHFRRCVCERGGQRRDDAAAHGGQVPEARPPDGAPAARERLRPAQPARVHQVAALKQHHSGGPDHRRRGLRRVAAPPGDFRALSQEPLSARAAARALHELLCHRRLQRVRERQLLGVSGCRGARGHWRQLLERQSRRFRRCRLAPRARPPPPAASHSPDIYFA